MTISISVNAERTVKGRVMGKSPSLAQINSILEKFDLKKTSLRQKILAQFLFTSKTRSQADIIESLEAEGLAVDRVSVYRNLNQMKISGLIHEIDSNQYIACIHECTSHPHLLLFCQKCAKHMEITDHEQVNSFLNQLSEFNFFGTKQTLALRGFCSKCSSNLNG